ncbi:MAG: preprotein translocase subunit SecF [Syntrophorhabdus sp. PtaB.Bin184]|jgi:preprotein translocase subunit SecF|nr:MAG: preprotein translocase subunit SecF [Syntrophorhabdus sp. PtaB.Bin184]
MSEFREIIKDTQIDFVGLRRIAFVFSGVLLLLGCIAFAMISMGKANLSTDFTGGTSIHVQFHDTVSIAELRNALVGSDMHDAQIQEVSGTKGFLIKTQFVDTQKENVQDRMNRILPKQLPDKRYEILESNAVGAAVGKTLKRYAIIATVVSFIGIVVYIAVRFNFIFGVVATIATFHDVLAMLGIFYIMGREINMLFITAILTVAGYSLTDTIVVFDRIRERMVKMKSREDFGNIVNGSINEVLSRTIVTNLTTLLVTAALCFLGGPVLFDFSLALVIGICIGTYSSIFIASPLVFIWRRKAL